MVLKTHIACYTAYGHASSTLGSFTGFNGEPVLKPFEQYALGAGHRLYSPSLMRFLSADSVSPFGKGGLNAYAYCAGDPVNRIDPTGQSWLSLLKGLGNRLGVRTPSSQRRGSPSSHQMFSSQQPQSPVSRILSSLPQRGKLSSDEILFLSFDIVTRDAIIRHRNVIYEVSSGRESYHLYSDTQRERVIGLERRRMFRLWEQAAKRVKREAEDRLTTYEQLPPGQSRRDTRSQTTIQKSVNNVRAA